MFDWQTAAVALIVLAALAYTARRAVARLRSFAPGARAGSSCATGCGKCGDESPRPAQTFVQISPKRTPTPPGKRG